MTDFDYEVKEKRRIASGARHRKCGSKSKRCTLPHERLTPTELKRRNGEVKTYNLSGPMSWGTFCQLPPELAREYILKLRKEYHVSCRKIAEMLGVGHSTLNIRLNVMGIDTSDKTFMSATEKKRWADFCNGGESLAYTAEEVSPDSLPIELKEDGYAARVETEGVDAGDTDDRIHCTEPIVDELLRKIPNLPKPASVQRLELYLDGSTTEISMRLNTVLAAASDFGVKYRAHITLYPRDDDAV